MSSVTTILTNLVGRSVVSAITQTPASGPLGLLTIPPRPALPTRTVSLLVWPASNPASVAARSTASTIIIPGCKALLLIVSDLLPRSNHDHSQVPSISLFSVGGRAARIFFSLGQITGMESYWYTRQNSHCFVSG